MSPGGGEPAEELGGAGCAEATALQTMNAPAREKSAAPDATLRAAQPNLASPFRERPTGREVKTMGEGPQTWRSALSHNAPYGNLKRLGCSLQCLDENVRGLER